MSTKYYTLPEVAALLGKSERQVRYMIQQNELTATKQGRRWVVTKDVVDATAARQDRTRNKLEHLEVQVRETLDLPKDGLPKWSVRTMRAVQTARNVHRALREALGGDHPATQAGVEAMRHLVQGGHAFRKPDKADAYHAARRAACDALTQVLLDSNEAADALANRIEGELLPALAGLLRKAEKIT